ncbi:MAG TPA: PIN/TRAM domain-containing protein, partial [Pirellulaceae bacterium]|nr:PIN/TRAM domain-containing protein [Pirellulaceae bacterium]
MIDKFKVNMPLWILRAFFLVVAGGVAVSIIRTLPIHDQGTYHTWGTFLGVMLGAAGVITIDALFPRKRLDIISCVYFGIIIGLFLTYVVGIAIAPIVEAGNFNASQIRLVIGMVLCYSCISLLMQTKDDFRFIIPYVEFAKEVKGIKPYVLDTSVVIDGRIADLVDTSVLDNQLIMPRFVLGELQAIADSSDKLRRERGRRGLDVLAKLRSKEHVDLKIYESELP